MRPRFPAIVATFSTIASLIALALPAGASADFIHTVMPGETLSSIAAADGLTVDQLAAANGLAPDVQLVAGSTLAIPPQSASTTTTSSAVESVASPSSPPVDDPDGDGDTDAPAATSTGQSAGSASGSSSGSAGSYVVQPGDTLTAIAARAGLSVDQLAAANGLDPNGYLLAGTVLTLSSQAGSASSAAGSSTTSSASPSGGSAGGSYVVQPGDTLTAIAARVGVSVDQLAAANGLDPNGVLLAGSVLSLSGQGASTSAPSAAPAVGTTLTGRMTWFGGPHDPSAQGAPASGLGWRSDGMAFYNYGSLGNRWLIHFPWGQTMPMTQIDIGPAPWTGNTFDLADSALPSTPYNWQTWPNPTVTGTYLGP